MSTDLSIIIVNWNGGELLRRCVETIVSSEPRVTYEVVIIDNASSDDSLDQLKAGEAAKSLTAHQQLRIFNNSENRGFGAANNQAFDLTDSPFVFLLNLDAEVHPGTIDTLMRTMLSDPKIGACGPKILTTDGSLQISAFFNPPRVWHTVLSQLKLYYLLPQRIRGELLLGRHWDHNRQRSVPMLSGAAILARRQMIEEVGGFDERFHMYAEDNEWCWRITRTDWKLVFVPEAVVLHHGGQSSMKRWSSDEKLRVKLEAGFYFEHRVLPRWRLAANQLANYLVVSAQIAGRQMRGIHIPELYLIKEMHREHLKRSLRNHLERK
ncbi:MAG TPA: glycosyltransferase family 2 protein [Pyrinomonadaceae bacterium]|nr:glycosyltransferase family 2 protein [Pyrinomonadaceae bacterium]